MAYEYPVVPEALFDVRLPVPFMSDGFVPLEVFNTPLNFVMPDLQRVGEGALHFSLGQPFGFVHGPGALALRSIKTDGFTLSPVPATHYKWEATITTTRPPENLDIGLLTYGIGFYVKRALERLETQEN